MPERLITFISDQLCWTIFALSLVFVCKIRRTDPRLLIGISAASLNRPPYRIHPAYRIWRVDPAIEC